MYGMLFSIRSFVSKMSPLDMKDGFLAFQTSRYKLHYYETPTGIKVVMNTDLGVGPIRDVLHHIYSAVSASPWDPSPKAPQQPWPLRLLQLPCLEPTVLYLYWSQEFSRHPLGP